MIITETLKELASLTGGRLYIVGGAVRDYLLGRKVYDIDLASPLRAEEITALSKGTKFKVIPNSLKLGTLGISADGEKYEYTAFRKDSYGSGGAHSPQTVDFGASITEDALRRDFTMNALYMDILSGQIIDVVGGVEDIEKGIIRTVREPHEVMSEDALRIMRMARLAAESGFEIEEKTMRCATEMSENLSNIAPERIREEFDKILVADTRHGIKEAHIRGIEILVKCGAMRYVVPELLDGIGLKQNAKYHKYDVYGHIMAVLASSPEEIRLAALFHDIAKPEKERTTGSSRGHAERGAEITEARMQALRYGKSKIAETKELVAAHMFDLKGDETEEAIRLFILEHIGLIDKILMLKDADWAGGKVKETRNVSADCIRRQLAEMREEGVAFYVKDLAVSGEDCLFMPAATRSRALKALLRRNANDASVRTKEGALEFLRNFKD